MMKTILSKNKIVFTFIVFMFTACKAQNTPIKIFDIETFENNKDHINHYSYLTDDNTSIEQSTWQFGYEEIIKPQKSHFSTFNKYNAQGKLIVSGDFFPNDFEKGVWKEYDEDGRLTKETDYDAPYKFDWGNVLKLIQNRGLDMDNYYFEILRGNSDKGTSWAVVWEKEDKTGLRVINIDGITGKITREAALEYPSDE